MSVAAPSVGAVKREGRPETIDQAYWETTMTPIRGVGIAHTTVHAYARRVLEKSPGPGQEPVMIEPRHYTVATPMLVIQHRSPAGAILLANEIGALPYDTDLITIPLASQICISATFQVRGALLQIRRRNKAKDLMFALQITERFAYFLSMTNNLSVNIVGGKQNWFVTMVERPRWQGFPLVASVAGLLNDGIRMHSTEWLGVAPSPDVLVGGIDEIATWAYGASTVDLNIPKVNSYYRDTCVRCGLRTELNKEHCTPKWLANLLGVEPVVGRILCPECNGHFGDRFEIPISKLYGEGKFRDPQYRQLVGRWALKTALTLTSMSNLSTPSWLWKVVDGQTAPSTLHIYHLVVPAEPHRGYIYSVTRFPRSMPEAFAFTIQFDEEMFLIVNSPNHQDVLKGLIAEKRAAEPMHESMIRQYFGVELERGEAVLRPSTRR
ncbi:Uncharacterised protein [Mycobacteroides abscessus subsp. abscessus]|nr:Uncharacterised protein [Mycobacteroides abscessus subsp. abscessus]SKU05550.1 Uncharacterised protein [Mycobacteroides abscessus subsp. massiliense]SID78638.1 Uncharacterised protein [Mycobacteroides abscessus subsp. abscessus]SII89667.1 Uncharacterised protein [Mycobacteroides abscessus subsp. abscessus]SIJ07523.1 Uncharacterised protein [Mycobacteroides abscessus subsp. abscessus]